MRLPLAALTLALATVACQSDLTFDNAPSELTRVGPAYCAGDDLVVHYTVFDLEGDPVSLALYVTTRGEAPGDERVALGDALDDVSTRPGEATEQVVVAPVGDYACDSPHDAHLALEGGATLTVQVR